MVPMYKISEFLDVKVIVPVHEVNAEVIPILEVVSKPCVPVNLRFERHITLPRAEHFLNIVTLLKFEISEVHDFFDTCCSSVLS